MFVDLPCQNSEILPSFEKYIIYGFYLFFGKALTVCWVFSTSKKFEFLQIRKKMMMMKYNMKTRILFIIIGCFVVCASKKEVQEKEEASTVPLGNTLSPPEGNTTFMGGTTWCVALPGASQSDLQIALDWACGAGMADCNPINPGGVCFQPDTLVSHASYAFNNYYQQNGNNDIACNFGGTATLTKQDPSYGKCSYSVSGPSNAAPSKLNPHRKMTSVSLLLLLYLTTYFAW